MCVGGSCQNPGQTWVQRSLATPTSVSATAGVWDSTRNVLVLFGGRNVTGAATTSLNTTWELSLSGWTQRTTGTTPPARFGHDVAYDPIRQRVVLFGGFQGPGLPRLGDTWEWNGVTGTWTQVTVAMAPTARSGHRMTWDPVRQHIVLFGGRIDGNVNFYRGDTWAYANGAWSELSTSGPPAREGGSLTWDPGLGGGAVVTFGGVGTSGSLNDTWSWNGTSWTQLQPTLAPTSRVFFDVAWHPGLGKLVLFGGSTGASSGYNAETWVFDRTTWTQLTPLTSPSARNGHVLEWDPLRMKLMLFGGQNGPTLNEQWEF